jgi:N-acetyl-anhydromuramyl-L-alanine amidase AmpD
MKLSLSITELNDLYYATSKLVEARKEDLKEYGYSVSSVTYLTRQLRKAEALNSRVQHALYDTIDEVEKLQDMERDYSAFKQYADSMNEAAVADRLAGNL